MNMRAAALQLGQVIAASQPPVEAPTLRQLARTYLDECGHDVACARKKLRDDIDGSDTLKASIVDEAIYLAVQQALTSANTKNRSAVWGMPDATEQAGKARGQVVALASGVVNSLYDFPLINGVKLGDAKRDEIQRQADAYGSVISDISTKRKFLLAVAAKLAPGRTVRQELTEDALAALKREALK